MIESIKLNIKMIYEITLKISGVIYTNLTVVLTFISWADIGINSDGLPIIVIYPEYKEKSDIVTEGGKIKNK